MKEFSAKELAKRLALTATTLLLLLGAAEISVRLFSDVVPPLLVGDPDLGNRYLRSFEGDVFVKEARRKVRLRFNRDGFRGPHRPFEKPDGVRRVAILGDSMTVAVSVDEQDTMVCQLEHLLNESHPEVKWEVLNFGVSGSSPGQELVVYRKLASKYDPDIVLCSYFVGNDLTDNCFRFSRKPRIYFDLNENGELYRLPFSAERASSSEWLNCNSRLYVWQKVAFERSRHAVRTHRNVLPPGMLIHCREESEDLAFAWRLSGEVVRQFADEAKQQGAWFGLVMIPCATQVYGDYFDRVKNRARELQNQFDADYPDERMAGLCREAGVSIIQMTDEFRRAAPSASVKVRKEWLFNNGTAHLNVKGHTVAAQVVHRYLTEAEQTDVAREPVVNRLR